MINDVTYVLQQVFLVIYIYIVVNRICICFENCSQQKALSNAYSRIGKEQWESLMDSIINNGKSKEK